MFVLSAIAVFLCVKIAETLFSSKNENTSWGNEAHHAQSRISFQEASQARFLRAHVLTQGSCVWGF